MQVTIIIPTFNSSQFLKPLLNDLGYISDTEIIFIDDGSEDTTVQIIKQWIKGVDNKEVRIIENSHVGVSRARNIGIMSASAKNIMFIDSDDRIDPIALNRIIHTINLNADIVSCNRHTKSTICTEQGRRKLVSQVLLDVDCGYVAAPWAKIYKTKFLIQNNIFFPENIKFGEDKLFNVDAILKTQLISINDLPFYNYRINYNSVTKKKNYDILSNSVKFIQKLQQIFEHYKGFNDLLNFVTLCNWIDDSGRAIFKGASSATLIKYEKEMCDGLPVHVSKHLGMKRKVLRYLLVNRMYVLVACYGVFIKLIRTVKKIMIREKINLI